MDHFCTALFFLNELTALGSWGYSRQTVWSAYGLSRAHRYLPELNGTELHSRAEVADIGR